MAGNRAFKGLANLRESFDQPLPDDEAADIAGDESIAAAVSAIAPRPRTATITSMPVAAVGFDLHASSVPRAYGTTPAISPITGKVDRRRLRKVLKTPSMSLSVAVRSELHEDVSAMLFARKSTWIAIIDELLTGYVAGAKSSGQFPK